MANNSSAAGYDVARKPKRAVSLFAGVGGFDLACQRAGIDVVAAVEIDKAARSVLARQFPATRLYEDVSRVHAPTSCPSDSGRPRSGEGSERSGDRRTGRSDVHPRHSEPARGVGDGGCPDCLPVGGVDLVCGGFPCQDLSVAGRRAGLAGLRSGLFYELARIISETSPRWVVLENVPGLLSSNDGRDMAAVVGTLGDLGYGWAYRVLDAQFFGVPQRRRRVFVVGNLGGRAAPVAVLLEPEGRAGNHRPVGPAREAIAGTLGGGSGSRGWAPDTDRMTFIPLAIRGRDGGAQLEAGEPGGPYNALRAGDGGSSRQSLIAFAWQAGGNNSASGAFKDDGTTPTLPKSQTLAVQDMAAVRRLTPLECERLQGFPDGWTEGQADSPRYKQMGNAVAVPVVEWIMRRLVATDSVAEEVGLSA